MHNVAMFYLKVFTLFLIAFIIQVQATVVNPIVETRNGRVMGKSVNNGANKVYYAFGNIPFAEPPVGDLRFEPPQPLERRWSGTLNGTSTELPLCVQLWTLTQAVGTEDCLYMNVFTPKLPRRLRRHGRRAKLLPVMVFIHGGGLMYGAANYYGEQHIMASEKMLLVTIHHRLNIFGYLSTEDDAVPGNMGFKDQSLALRWVHENIAAFGGDKRKVLFTGWSGGGASISYHMVSEMTPTSWFNSAASFSGSALCPCHTIYPGEARRRAGLMAQYLSCSATEIATGDGIKRCLKRKTDAEIMREMPKLYAFREQPFSIFGAVIEYSTQRPRFLADHVESLLANCRAKRTPWLITRTAEDGTLFTAEFLKKDANGREGIYELNEKWLEWAPTFLFMNISLTPQERRDLAQNYKERYFGSEDITMENYKNLDRLMNDEFSTRHVQRTAESFVKGTRGATAYGYVYDNPAPFGLGQFISERTDLKFGSSFCF